MAIAYLKEFRDDAVAVASEGEAPQPTTGPLTLRYTGMDINFITHAGGHQRPGPQRVEVLHASHDRHNRPLERSDPTARAPTRFEAVQIA